MKIITICLVLSGLLLTACERPQIEPVEDRFSKLDKQGKALDIQAGLWACTYDKNTGLTWENKTDDLGLHHYKWTYTFSYQPTQRQGKFQGSCNYNTVRACTTADYIAAVNQQNYCGYNDWRLPDIDELQSIIDPHIKKGYVKVCNCAFAHTVGSSYWSNYEDQGANRKILGLHFKNLQQRAFSHSASLYVRLVRDQKKPIEK